MTDAAILDLILQSAVRSLLLGLCVYALVKFVRLRDVSAETTIWSVVLGAALLMPALTAWLPAMDLRVAVAAPRSVGSPALVATPTPAPWLIAHAGRLALAAYGLVAAAGLSRLAIGLALTARLHARAEPIADLSSPGRDIRQSGAIRAPLSYARSILLPLEWRDWETSKLQAVLAHEACHVRRGDFFILLLASAHRAIFWFSPFAWWLQAHLGELAETASDKAAIREIADAAGYAEILIEVARRAAPAPADSALALAMAKGPGIARRIDHILTDMPEKTLSVFGRTLALAAVLTLSFGLAAVRAAAIGPAASSDPSAPPPLAQRAGLRPQRRATAAARGIDRRLRSRHIHTVRIAAPAANGAPRPAASPPTASIEDPVAYNPRALLEQPVVAVLPSAILVGRGPSAPDADN